jgi:hypothetical protein
MIANTNRKRGPARKRVAHTPFRKSLKTITDEHQDAQIDVASGHRASEGERLWFSCAHALRVETRPPHQAALGSSFGNRIRLKAALAKTPSQSALGSPRNFTLRTQAIVFDHPNASARKSTATASGRERRFSSPSTTPQ